MNNRQYLIFPVTELGNVDFSQIEETSINTIRKSINQTKTFIKWEGSTPSFISTLDNTEGPYNRSEILSILSTPEWYDPNQIK